MNKFNSVRNRRNYSYLLNYGINYLTYSPEGLRYCVSESSNTYLHMLVCGFQCSIEKPPNPKCVSLPYFVVLFFRHVQADYHEEGEGSRNPESYHSFFESTRPGAGCLSIMENLRNYGTSRFLKVGYECTHSLLKIRKL